ncbi:MAG: c-type cytochrome [bacterium]|nr:c-type cytochrome [bacterium]
MPATVPAPEDNQPTEARIELGRKLFFDPLLSGTNSLSCATCHNPGLAWTDGLPTAVGMDMAILDRNTPTIVNTAFASSQFWDGRAKTLEEQALGPLTSPNEMAENLATAIGELKAIPGYVELFEEAYPGEGIKAETIARALANFQRTIIATTAPFDRWLAGDSSAMSESAVRGFEVFKGKGACEKCHSGFNFSDGSFHNIGIKQSAESLEDLGRYVIVPLPRMRGAFKTPTLRDVALTAPYMRDGSYATLMEVVEHYDRGGDDKTNLSPDIEALNLSDQEKQDLVEFMRSLTGEQKEVPVPLLPR